jgi:sterol desaturase/sphingolipid hydroxylase (fatty acid hydroxylase superfamily)
MILDLLFGFLIGTFAEYWVHRALHIWFPVFHAKHHDNPKDYEIGGSWATHLAIVFIISTLMTVFFSLWVAVGFCFWYIFYAGLHYYSHHIPAMKDSWIDYAQYNHIVHHNENDFNYGVTVPIWDIIFMTYKRGINRNKHAS